MIPHRTTLLLLSLAIVAGCGPRGCAGVTGKSSSQAGSAGTLPSNDTALQEARYKRLQSMPLADVRRELERLFEEYRELEAYIIPPIGTPCEDVQKVFGRPHRVAPYGRFKEPCHQYLLVREDWTGERDVAICVRYGGGNRVSETCVRGIHFVQGRYGEDTRDVLWEYEIALSKLEKAKASFEAALKEASWNKGKK